MSPNNAQTKNPASGQNNFNDVKPMRRLRARRLVLAGAVAVWLVSTTAAGVPAQSATTSVNGAYANLNGILPSLPITFFHLEAYRTLNGATQGGYVIYDRTTTVSDCVNTDEFGYGNIPLSSFTGSSDKHLTLNVDTGVLSGFVNSFCSNDWCNSIFTCNDTRGGLFSLDWAQNHISSESRSGSTTYTSGPITEYVQGTSSDSSARVEGTFLCDSLSNTTTDGGVGDIHNALITITRTPHP